MAPEIIDNPKTGERLTVLESTPEAFKMQVRLAPNGKAAAVHAHPMVQTFHVVSGAIVCRVGGENVTLRAGQSKSLAPLTGHDQGNPFDVDAVVIEEYRPAGRIHAFFRVLFAMAAEGKTDDKGMPPLLLAVAIFAEFHDTIRMPNAMGRLLVRTLTPLSRWLGHDKVVRSYLQRLESPERIAA